MATIMGDCNDTCKGTLHMAQNDILLRVENLGKKFGDFQAVSECSFTVKRGTITGLIGPNGAGKTTTFNMIAGALTPTSGDIIFQGKSLAGLKTHEMFHQGIVRTFQIPHEFSKMTVLENLMVVPAMQTGENLLNVWFKPSAVAKRESEVRKKASEVLDFLNISHVKNELAGRLSGGQKKLLELGRTMMHDSTLVLLDEPGAGVNPSLVMEIRTMIARMRDEMGYTFILIEHDMDMINALCDTVYVMAEGTILTKGSMDDIRKNKHVLDAYLGGA